MPSAFTSMKTTTPAPICSQWLWNTARSSAMPTLRKNSPSRMPRKGSMSASSWWRKLLSDSITPARKAPIAIDSPADCISSAEPSTTSSAAAVMTSRASAAASTRNIGFSSQRPAATTPATATSATATTCHTGRVLSTWAGAISATTTSNGTMARSSSSRIDTTRWPLGDTVSPRSSSSSITVAVDVSTKPIAATKATGHASPASMPTPVSSVPQASTCASPRPKISRRRLHSRVGCISSPMMNRNITTPSSATCRMAAGSANSAAPKGPMATPAAR